MEILLDNHFTGMAETLRSFGHVVYTTSDVGTVNDKELVLLAKEKGYVFVTQNKDASWIAESQKVKVILINMGFLGKSVHRELTE